MGSRLTSVHSALCCWGLPCNLCKGPTMLCVHQLTYLGPGTWHSVHTAECSQGCAGMSQRDRLLLLALRVIMQAPFVDLSSCIAVSHKGYL